MAQDKTIPGWLTDANDGSGLPGVSVTVVGAKTGTQINSDGRFAIKVPSNANLLMFSFIGYTGKTVKIARVSLSFSL